MTLENLPLKEGYWRWRPDVTEVVMCLGASAGEVTGCAGGEKFGEYCRENRTGPYCALCEQKTTHYLNEVSSRCEECSEFGQIMLLALYTTLCVVAACLLIACWPRRRRRRREKDADDKTPL